MARSIPAGRSREPKGVGSASAAAWRATPAAGGRPARGEARPEAPAAPDQRRPPEPISGRAAEPMSESARPALEPSAAVPAALDPAQAPSAESAIAEPTPAPPTPAESALGAPIMAPPAEVPAAVAEPLAPAVDEPPAPAAVPADLPEPAATAAGRAPATAAISWPGGGLVEGSIRIRSEMIAFTWRQTEHGHALGRALLASRSLPEILALQTAYLGETLERTVAHSLELARLSTDLLRAGVPSPRAG